MFISVVAPGVAALEDRHNFRAFKIVAGMPGAGLDEVRRALSGIAEVSDRDTVWVFQDALRRWPGVADDAAWQNAFAAMIEKARPHGWIDDNKKAIKAHIEWPA
jgi:predicted transcriptional regulator